MESVSERNIDQASGPDRDTDQAGITGDDVPEIEQKKYYKQAFKKQWMTLPEFKEWLCPAPGNKYAAYCRFCKNTLRAHKLSLTKHIATWKHQKKSRAAEEMGDIENDSFVDWNTKSIQIQCSANDTMNDDDDDYDDSFRDEGMDDRSDGENDERKPMQAPQQVKIVEVQKPPPPKSPLSTHVLDTCRGMPAAGLSLSLYKLIDSKWVLLSEGMTNSQGRFTDFIDNNGSVNIGRYKMHFDVDRYFELRRQECFYPFVEVIFDIKNPNDHYHVPLLLSPYSYTTYRGS